MKKLFTILAIGFAVLAANAQTVVLQENFDEGTPSGWIINDADLDGFEWGNTLDVLGTDYGYNGSAGCMYSQSYDNSYGALTPDNWLITPQVNLGVNSNVHFYVTAQDANYDYEHWGVYVSTTGTNPSDFTVVYEETFPGAKDQATWREHTIDLSAFTGNVYIAFRHFDCTDAYWFELDEVTVTTTQSQVGIGENTASQFSVYPNPATSTLNVKGEGNVEIINTLGQVVMMDMVNGQAQLNVSNLDNGVYFVRMNGTTQKFIKK